MKILEYGELPPVKRLVYTGRCKNCGCKVEAEQNEIIYVNVVGYKDRQPKVTCPTTCCCHSIYLTCKEVVEKPNIFRTVAKNGRGDGYNPTPEELSHLQSSKTNWF
jgi:hypothetical protein